MLELTGLTPWEIVAGAVIMFAGAMTQGCTGFGIALVAAPALMIFMPHAQVPVLIILLALLNNTGVLIETRRSLRFRYVLPLVIGGVVGLPVGAGILSTVNATGFTLGVGLIVFIAAVLMVSGFRVKFRNENHAMLPVGVLSGILKGSTSIGGPPIVLFLTNQGADKQSFRANLVAYFAVIDSGAILAWWYFGLLNAAVLLLAALYALPVIAGTWCGILLARRIDEALFKRAVLVLVAVLGVVLVYRSLAPFYGWPLAGYH